MKEADIRKYAGLMQELELTALEITEEDKTVRLERTPVPAAREAVTMTLEPEMQKKREPLQENSDYISVKSTIVGVFYASPAENAEPFVKIGDRVGKGKVLCIIEAMKLMNEICAEDDGVITEICVTNGQVVEYGTELFRIRR